MVTVIYDDRPEMEVWRGARARLERTSALASGDNLDALQEAVCRRFGVKPYPAPLTLKVGIARNVRGNLQPVNGVRYPPEGDTTGWYIWAGEEMSEDPDFFVPLHAEHLVEWRPEVLPYLALPPGWRFLIGPGYEDVWEDPNALEKHAPGR